MPPLRVRFGRTVAHLRKTQTSYSQESLAHAVGMHRTFISLVERGLANPSLDTIEKLARALKVPPARLLSESDRER